MSIAIAAFTTHKEAESAVESLRKNNFGSQDISIVAKIDQEQSPIGLQHQNLTDGTLTGAGIGGVLGLLTGIGAIIVPGFGNLAAVGPLAAAVAGITAGGLAGGLIDYGIPENKSKGLETKLNEGSIIVSVETTSKQETAKAIEILKTSGALDTDWQ